MVIEDKEKRPRTPIIFRAHQLPQMAWAMGLGLYAGTPESVARRARKDTVAQLKAEDPEDREYAYRTVGEYGQHARTYEEVTRIEMKRFVNADPRQPCIIVEGLLGDICRRLRRCGLGDHCLKGISEDFDLFIDAAEQIGLSEEIKVEIVKATFSNAPSQKGRKLTTTVGVVKDVLFYLNEVDGI